MAENGYHEYIQYEWYGNLEKGLEALAGSRDSSKEKTLEKARKSYLSFL